MNYHTDKDDVVSHLASFDNPVDATRAAIMMALVTRKFSQRRRLLLESLNYLSQLQPKPTMCNDPVCKYVWGSVVTDDEDEKKEDEKKEDE